MLTHILPDVENSKALYYCAEAKGAVPFFKQVEDTSINQDIFKSLVQLNNETFVDDVDNAGLENVPDGAITFFEANDEKLRYRLQINDVRLMEYHR